MQTSNRNLVAGGAGFVGSNLCLALLRAGESVLCVDNLSTGRTTNIEPLFDWPGFEFVEADIVSWGGPVGSVDRIFHLASPASPPGYKRLPVETIRVNTEGTRRLLEIAQEANARFLFASTSEAYGDPLEHPQREEYRGNVSSTGPRSMYDEAKRCGEAFVVAFAHQGVDARVVRIFNTYGPNSDPADGRLVPNFVCQALTNQPITIYGDGAQTRSLCYVDDLVQGLRLVMQSPLARGEVINLGNPDEHSVADFARIIKELASSSSPVVYCDPAVGDDPQRRRPDIGKAKRLIGWEPRVPLKDGLARTIEYFQAELFDSIEVPA